MEKKRAVKENSKLLHSDFLGEGEKERKKKKKFHSSSTANHKTYFSATVLSVKPLTYSLSTIN
jgi:hypothetical protein